VVSFGFAARTDHWAGTGVSEAGNGARRGNAGQTSFLLKKSCKLLPFCNFNAEARLFIQTPKSPFNGSKRGISRLPWGKTGHCFCMSKERSDSMGTTESPFSTADKTQYTPYRQKGKEIFDIFHQKNGFAFLFLEGLAASLAV